MTVGSESSVDFGTATHVPQVGATKSIEEAQSVLTGNPEHHSSAKRFQRLYDDVTAGPHTPSFSANKLTRSYAKCEAATEVMSAWS